MDQVICYTESTGTVSVILPAPGGNQPNESDDEFLLRLAQESTPDDAAYEIVDHSLLPDGNYLHSIELFPFRINMDKAKEIHRGFWRELRVPRLQILDVEYIRADEQNDAELKAQIAAKKQLLRDVTETDLSHINNIEDLKEAWPDILIE
jgi:hypothetical protein